MSTIDAKTIARDNAEKSLDAPEAEDADPICPGCGERVPDLFAWYRLHRSHAHRIRSNAQPVRHNGRIAPPT